MILLNHRTQIVTNLAICARSTCTVVEFGTSMRVAAGSNPAQTKLQGVDRLEELIQASFLFSKRRKNKQRTTTNSDCQCSHRHSQYTTLKFVDQNFFKKFTRNTSLIIVKYRFNITKDPITENQSHNIFPVSVRI